MAVPAHPPTPILVYPRSFCSLLPSAPVLWIPWDAAVPGQDYFPWITDSISMRNCCWSSGDKCSCSSREGSVGLGLHCPYIMETGSIPVAFPAHNWNSIRNCKHGLWDINAPLNSLEWGGMGGGEQGKQTGTREQTTEIRSSSSRG